MKNGVSMAVRFHTFVTAGLAGLLTAGCSLNPWGGGNDRYAAPPPLTAVPSGSVTGSALPPPGEGASGESATGLAALDPSANNPAPAAATSEISRTDLLGGWTIVAAGESCQLFMTLTTWAGGYRASTRNCTNAVFQGVSAWNIEGGQVQLLNDAGTTVARLYPTSKSQLDGQTPGGGPITVTR
jgi:hypothetical protein